MNTKCLWLKTHFITFDIWVIWLVWRTVGFFEKKKNVFNYVI
jgi:hypothetical protein